ncbi:hypothetical protein HELRODRAFT_179432 [Helobdella robusta]|uniref:THAP-type domain-containing protein n=1 Tax=Helobdella robusta TaxID=6412 RepID=T1FEP4_HELRO|nr:hypothetical protein HELRODRAFT_179432 [Helobdella robusta]ESN95362.1 hypothetical protein HELRODRAFT_179432 [Helobdella robusta]
MPLKCIVNNCNGTYKDQDISMHRCRGFERKRSYICSKHFDSKSFSKSNKKVFLKKDAYPTVFPGVVFEKAKTTTTQTELFTLNLKSYLDVLLNGCPSHQATAKAIKVLQVQNHTAAGNNKKTYE